MSQQALRIVQEALTNVVSHAGANSVRVGVIYGDEELLIVVEDDGRFDLVGLTAQRRSGLETQPALCGQADQVEAGAVDPRPRSTAPRHRSEWRHADRVGRGVADDVGPPPLGRCASACWLTSGASCR